MQSKFLGRPLDTNTMTYSFGEGDYKFPVEMMEEVNAECDTPVYGRFLRAMGIISDWKLRLKGKGPQK